MPSNRVHEEESTEDVQTPEWIKRMQQKPPTIIYKGNGFTKNNSHRTS